MPRTLPDRSGSRLGGITLVEMVIAMVVVGIIVAATVFFAYPVRQAVDVVTRAELTDIADNALQRIGRDVRLALPNSVRVDGTKHFIELIPLRTAGRYRGEPSGNTCTGATPDDLSFDTTPADTCFKTIGTLSDAPTVVGNADFLVLNNYGEGFASQNAYRTAGDNWRKVVSVAIDAPPARHVVTFDPTTGAGGPFTRTLHDSPGRRFYIVVGNGNAPSPVTFECSPPILTRRAGYNLRQAQPVANADFVGGTQVLLAENVASCEFEYNPNVSPQVALLTLRLTLSKATTSGQPETVSLYHAVHVSNVP